MENCYLYILKSQKNDSYYVGCSSNPLERLQEHNIGRVTATRKKGPWEIKFLYPFNSAKKTKQIEYNLKKKKSRKILEQIIKEQKINFIHSESSSDG